MRLKIIEATTELGLGGTEYVLQLYSKYLNKVHFEVTVVAIDSGGDRVALISDLGIKVHILQGDMSRFEQIVADADVFHWHGNGMIRDDVAQVLRRLRPKLIIQTNVFGKADVSGLIDYDLYVSQMILIRRMAIDDHNAVNHTAKRLVLANPVDTDHFLQLKPSGKQLSDFRKEHGLVNNFVLGRIGRADDAKFDLITLDAFAIVADQLPLARFLLVGATPKIVSYAQSIGILKKLVIFDNTSDLRQLVLFYSAIDVFIAASTLGESFGLSIAEAMTLGVPVITVSTPDKDNAQVELVDHLRTGIVVARDAHEMASAAVYLHVNKQFRQLLRKAASAKVIDEYSALPIVNSLGSLILNHFNEGSGSNLAGKLLHYSRSMVEEYNLRVDHLWSSKDFPR